MTTQALLEELKKLGSQRVILFWGSGIVRSLGYPSWEDLLLSAASFAEKFNSDLAGLVRRRVQKGEFFAAGDLLFEPEIPPPARSEFLMGIFDRSPSLMRIHQQLAACPFAAFVTANFDRTIEQSLTANKKTPESLADSNRFSRFNSRLSVYSSPPSEWGKHAPDEPQRLKNGLVLKVHGDITSPQDIILGGRQIDEILHDEAFKQLYKRLLSTYTLVFVGYSGKDPCFEWHCKTLIPICGIPATLSFLLHPTEEAPPPWLKDAGIVSVPFSTANEAEELSTFARQLSDHFKRPDALSVAPPYDSFTDAQLTSLAFIFAGLTEDQHGSGFQCAINSMVAEAGVAVGGLEDPQPLAEHIARSYHLPFREAGQIVERADMVQARSLLARHATANENLNTKITLLATGISSRANAIGVRYGSEKARQVVVEALVHSLSSYGNALALSLIDAEPPEATLVDRVVRLSIAQLNIPGIGTLDKEILSTAFADMFIHPSREEAHALILLSQASIAHALATTFSGGLKAFSDLLPVEAYLDSNVSIPLVVRDHPRSAYYNELVVRLTRADCSVFVLDFFLDEMANHCRRGFEEIAAAGIKTSGDAKSYADFHGALWINAFIAAFALGGRDDERFESFLSRSLGSPNPREKDFRLLLRKLGVEVLSTSGLDKSQSASLGIHIGYEKGRLMRLKAQVLADHEALQIQWLHRRKESITWFITEDSALRRILRNLASIPFSELPPSRGIVPAQGAFLLLSSISERPSLQGSFVQFLWNPLYVELVDSMLASVIRKMPEQFKNLKQAGFAELREKVVQQMQREMERSHKDDMLRRVKEYKLGRPQIIESVLKALGEQA